MKVSLSTNPPEFQPPVKKLPYLEIAGTN